MQIGRQKGSHFHKIHSLWLSEDSCTVHLVGQSVSSGTTWAKC